MASGQNTTTVNRFESSESDGLSTNDTLLWIGPHETAEFCDAFEFCSEHASQIAVRSDIEDALHRMPGQLGAVLIACPDDSACTAPSNTPQWSLLSELGWQLPIAPQRFLMMGTLCAGQRPSVSESFDGQTFYWHAWNQILPFQLQRCGVSAKSASGRTPHSLAIVSESHAAADALMEVVADSGASVVWYRNEHQNTGRNFDAVWWDDSAASSATGAMWNLRMSAMRSPKAHHAWITSAPTAKSIQDARRGGIDWVLSKPMRIESLRALLGLSVSSGQKSQRLTSRAA
ncbi:hypothetical protein [Stieleria varia]|uniref:Uncharacterized protein n=1 Tax=Stieleria varia TaxID=2528005 RepID=A0A5C6AX16_9BACT|nr:hypothetical protein [Stieleria varia]TWU02654.1 hypothetical protein Pla52n_37110 [Stieleria varia]